jgi:hypothetical protein
MSVLNNSNAGQEWQPVDDIVIVDGRILLPIFPSEPGVYRLRFDENTYYIGEANNINRRVGDYHTPGQGIVGDHRIHRALIAKERVSVDVITGIEFADRPLRCKREREEIKAAYDSGKSLLNGGRYASAYSVNLDITYHEQEIKILREQLTKLSKQV